MTRRRNQARAALAAALASALLGGCAGSSGGNPADGAAPTPVAEDAAPTPSRGGSPDAAPSGSTTGSATAPPTGSTTGRARAEEDAPEQSRSAPEPRRSYLSIPGIGLRSFPVVRYRGRPDDAPGTAIQNRGPTASPRGPRGGTGPGEVGNFIVTGHRTSHSAPFRDLPALRTGSRVRVRSGRTVYVYRITRTRETSFRSRRSLAEQAAAVPGRPDADPVRPMITLSTCATPEDHAEGNYWSDRFGNPEHRIDKVGVLVRAHR